MPKLTRMFRHLFFTHWQSRRIFSKPTLTAIEQEIKRVEKQHLGEIRFVVEGALPVQSLFLNQSSRARAVELFAHLHMWDTEYRNGVLIYVLLADRAVEIVADRGVHAKTDTPHWGRICHSMEAKFRAGQYKDGAVEGVTQVGKLLMHHFPSNAARGNELPDAVIVI